MGLCREPVGGENRTIPVVKFPLELQVEIVEFVCESKLCRLPPLTG